MLKLLLTSGVLGLSLTAASAECAYHKTVQASESGKTVVASNEAGVATSADQATAETVKPAEDSAQPAQ